MARSKFRAGDRDKAKALFRALPRSVRKTTAVALDKSAAELTEIIKRAVPVDDGDLRDSVKWRRGAPAKRGVIRDRDLSVTVSEGDRKAFYAPFVEFGTKDQPGQPHFFPSYRANRKRLARRIKAAQRRAIKEAAK